MYLIRTIFLQIAQGICFTKNSALNLAAYKIVSRLINAVKQDGGITSYPVYLQLEDKSLQLGDSASGLLGDDINGEKNEEEDGGGELRDYHLLLTLLTKMGLVLPEYRMEMK